LFEWGMFEMTVPIQSPTKSEVCSVIRFLNAKGECPVEIHKQIVAVYGDVMNQHNVTKWCYEFSEGKTSISFCDLLLTFWVPNVHTIFCTLIFLSQLHELWSLTHQEWCDVMQLSYCPAPICMNFSFGFLKKVIRGHRWPTATLFIVNISPLFREFTAPLRHILLMILWPSDVTNCKELQKLH
jgi:hypothetical protein